jgi:hypothetical protein
MTVKSQDREQIGTIGLDHSSARLVGMLQLQSFCKTLAVKPCIPMGYVKPHISQLKATEFSTDLFAT